MRSVFFCTMFVWLAMANSAQAAINVFTCEPEWGSLVEELAGDRANVYVATTAKQDIHKIQARPSLIARARLADLAVCSGASLEIGWMPLVQRGAGNEKIQLGKPGFLEVANYVPRIEVPTVLDRAMGDVHPQGNPHIQWGPRQVQLAANEIAARLAEADPAGKAEYEQRLTEFTTRWTAATARWLELGAPLKRVGVIQHHVNYSYLFQFLGMRLAGTLEPRPGVEPTSSHLNDLIAQQQRDPAKLIVRSSYHSSTASEWLAEHAGIPAVLLPASVGGTEKARDLFSMYDDAIQRMLAAIAS